MASTSPSAIEGVSRTWWRNSTVAMLPRAKSFWVSPTSRNWRMNTLPSLASMTSSTASGLARFTRVSTGR